MKLRFGLVIISCIVYVVFSQESGPIDPEDVIIDADGTIRDKYDPSKIIRDGKTSTTSDTAEENVEDDEAPNNKDDNKKPNSTKDDKKSRSKSQEKDPRNQEALAAYSQAFANVGDTPSAVEQEAPTDVADGPSDNQVTNGRNGSDAKVLENYRNAFRTLTS